MKATPLEVSRGRFVVGIFIASAVTTGFWGCMLSSILNPETELIYIVLQQSLTAILLFLLWRGFAWARWLLVFCYFGVAVYLMYSMFTAFSVWLPAMASLFGVWVGLLAFVPAVTAFQTSQREKRKSGMIPAAAATEDEAPIGEEGEPRGL